MHLNQSISQSINQSNYVKDNSTFPVAHIVFIFGFIMYKCQFASKLIAIIINMYNNLLNKTYIHMNC